MTVSLTELFPDPGEMMMNIDITVTTVEEVQRSSAYQALQPVIRPDWWGVDLDASRRPGVPMERAEPRPMPNTRFPPERQSGTPAAPRHGRPNKPMPPVFGTSTPLHGLSGAIRRIAYRAPDHFPRHWLLMLLGDRVKSWGARARRYLPLVLPVVLIGYFGRRAVRR